MKNKLTSDKVMLIIGIVIIIFMFTICLLPKLFTSYTTKEMFTKWQEPSTKHLLGTNDMGYDIFTELVYAAPITLFTGVTSACISMAIGTVVGLCAGYSKGLVKEIFDFLINIFLLIPMLPMCIVLTAFMGPGTKSIIFTLSVLSWSSTARVVRSKTESLKEQPFVENLRLLKIPKARILFKHIMPNLSEVVFSRFITGVANCILTETTLSFLGLGNTTTVTWGGMINFAYKRGGFMRGAYAYFLAPGVMILLTVMAFYFINCYISQRSNKLEISVGSGYLD